MKSLSSSFLASILFLGSSPTEAQIQPTPPCWPKQIGSTGSFYKTGETETTRWVGWTCTSRGGVSRIYGVVALKGYQIIHPSNTLQTSTPISTVRAYWALNVRDPKNVSLLPGWIALQKEFSI